MFQRDNSNQTHVPVAGSCPVSTDRVEAQFVPLTAGQGQPTDWQVLDNSPVQGQFSGRLPVRGGWYRLDVRAWQGSSIVASGDVQPVGVGEVFAVAG